MVRVKQMLPVDVMPLFISVITERAHVQTKEQVTSQRYIFLYITFN